MKLQNTKDYSKLVKEHLGKTTLVELVTVGSWCFGDIYTRFLLLFFVHFMRFTLFLKFYDLINIVSMTALIDLSDLMLENIFNYCAIQMRNV